MQSTKNAIICDSYTGNPNVIKSERYLENAYDTKLPRQRTTRNGQP